MAEQPPSELVSLLTATDPTERDRAWSTFLEQHSRLLLRVAHSLGGDHDTVMDRYAYVLERLRGNEFARLRGYAPDERCKFTTWLVVVTRRLCLDHVRRLYGEASTSSEGTFDTRAARRRLVDLLGEDIDPSALPGPATESPDWAVRSSELRQGLERAVEALDSRDRLLLRLRFEFELSAREIAGLMTLPSPFHVYRRLNHLQGRLREGLIRQDIEDPTP